jgi:hypothetical protein
MEARIYALSGNSPPKIEHYDYVGRDDDCDSYIGSQKGVDPSIAKLVEIKMASLVGRPSVTSGMGVTSAVEISGALKEDLVELTPQPEDPADTIHPHVKIHVTWHLKAGKDVEVEKTANTTVLLGSDRELAWVVPFNGTRMLMVLTAKPK